MTALQHDDLARVLLQVVVILGASRALAFVTRRLGQPSVVAETIAGILLGPSLLGWDAPALADHWRLSGDRLGRARDSLFQRVSVPLLVVHDAGAVAESPRVAEVIA